MFKSDNKTPVANICVIAFCWSLNVFHLDISIYLWCVGRFGTIFLILKRWKTPMEDSACKFAKINTPPWVFFTFFKLYKWYQIAQRTTNNLGKQLFQAICSKYVFRLLHALKFHVFSAKLNMMVKVVKLLTGVLWKSCSDEFYRKLSMRESLF